MPGRCTIDFELGGASCANGRVGHSAPLMSSVAAVPAPPPLYFAAQNTPAPSRSGYAAGALAFENRGIKRPTADHRRTASADFKLLCKINAPMALHRFLGKWPAALNTQGQKRSRRALVELISSSSRHWSSWAIKFGCLVSNANADRSAGENVSSLTGAPCRVLSPQLSCN